MSEPGLTHFAMSGTLRPLFQAVELARGSSVRKGWRTEMSYHLIDVLQQLGHPRLLVIGDLILDRYVWGEAERVSQEAPVILLRQEHDETRLGGAANVANMIRGLDADVTIAGV